MGAMMAEPVWRKSSHSHVAGTCVEVAFDGADTLLRDSKGGGGPVLRFNSEEWRAFLAGARDGEFTRS